MLKRIALALVAVVACASLAAFGQMWMPFPQIGGPSFCASTVNGNCVTTVPAGPSVTGLETIPIDTNASQGQSPQTGKISILTMGAGPYVYVAPTTGDTIAIANTTRRLIIHGSGTFSALTLTTPVSTTLLDGQLLSVCGDQIVTTLTVTAGSGTTVSDAPTAMLVPVATGAASCFGWIYDQPLTTWFRVQ